MNRATAGSAGLVLAGIVSVQFGASIAARLFGTVSPASLTTLRLWAATLVLALLAGRGAVRTFRSLWQRRSWGDLLVVAGFGVTLGVMNFAIYQSFARIPLGVAVTVEFLGPLAVSVCSSRHKQDLVWAGLGAAGVVLLSGGAGGHLSVPGLLFGLLAGACWACYILLSRASGQRFSGPAPLVLAMAVAALVVTPGGVASGLAGGGGTMFRPSVLADALAIGVLSSVVPYWLELEVLRRIPARVFGIWMSLEPAVAALIGLAVLSQRLSLVEWLAIGCVIVASAGAARLRYPCGGSPTACRSAFLAPDAHVVAPARPGRGDRQRGDHVDRGRGTAVRVRAGLPVLAAVQLSGHRRQPQRRADPRQ